MQEEALYISAATQKPPSYGWYVTIPAKVVSYVFHPLFIPTYVFMFMVYQFPYEFAGITDWQLKMRMFSVFWITGFFPAFAVFLLWRLKFSDSIFLRTQKERIIPYFISMFFYWWMYYLSRNFTDQPQALKFFYFGIFIATALGVIANNFIKISLHGIAMGGAFAAILLTAFFYQTPLGVAISITTILTGLVCTSRLLVSNHTYFEVYSGLFLGIICQLIGYWFV
ncbi:MAG: hypothetical protein ACOVNY_00760 [Chitinophagaceae bacterium]